MTRILGAVSIVCLLSLSLAAVGQEFHGSLTGVCQDADGRPIPAARVVLKGLGSANSRAVITDERGAFRLDELLPGSYHLIATTAGFAEADSQVTIAVSSTREVVIRLRPGTLRQVVRVQGEVSSITTQPVDHASNVHQTIVSARDLETLPLAARSFANVAYLAPGTEPVEPSDPTKARITAVSSGGSSGLNMELSVDGIDDSDDYIGGFLQNFSPDAIQQFSVRTAQEDADTSRTTGSSIVISTQHGTDNWHGGAAFYFRAAALNARFPIDNPERDPKQPFSRQNYVGTLGGPIKPGTLWFFSSLEALHEDASIAYSPSTLGQFTALSELAAQGLVPGVTSIPVPQNVSVPFRDYLGMVRVDWSASARSHWFLRTAIDNYTTDNAFIQQAALPSTGATSHNNYLNAVISNQFAFSPSWVGSLTLGGGGLYLTEARNAHLGFALAFPFTVTSSTISGFETFGDNQFITPITAFPVLRMQEKYQVRYDVHHTSRAHSPSFGVNLIHEPVMSGALAATEENLVSFPENPEDYLNNTAQFTQDYAANSAITPAGDGSFSQNVQRLGIYGEDSWHVRPRLVLNYGLRWDTTFGLFTASGRSQAGNPALLTLRSLQIPLVNGIPHDYRAQWAPRVGLAYSMGKAGATVVRAGFGLFYNDLAQNGWVGAFQAVNAPLTAPCAGPGDPGCLGSAASPGPIGTTNGSGALIDPNYKTPYAIHVTGGLQHMFNANWIVSADFTHEEGNHSYRRYQYQAGYTVFSPLYSPDTDSQRNAVPDFSVFRTDNRSSYQSLSLQLQGNVSSRLNAILHYTLSSAKTWGCVLGELSDYVNGVCDPLHAFGPGDYGPSGEDVRHRLVLAGTVKAPGGVEIATLSQFESSRPFTLTTSEPVNGLGDSFDNRAVVNGKTLGLDTLRGTPYAQVDMRVSRPINIHEHWSLIPFAEFFNLFNRNNPGANYVTDVAALPVPQSEVAAGNVTDICTNSECSQTQHITSPNQLREAAGGLGDFFGPGTTVGIPFAAQLGVRISF